MATNNTLQTQSVDWLDEEDDLQDVEDTESLASAEEDQQDRAPEAVLSEFVGKNDHTWYLIKWQDSPLLWSSWECGTIFDGRPALLEQWKEEKQKQLEGKSKPLDVKAFNEAVAHVETAERQRRILRRLRRRIKNVLNVIDLSHYSESY
ncbi:hypothetical protein BP5796_11795 [Coleophoma crateriformis]|uniref:Chromo domain-containing protein n=1 Tax=Coleophoma crateriformis TaxID=565419 RepID=A0A3D8QEE8_9HELO|nr:hypothetical protein BP5796_11795 [Coleophoma crateriformis]